MLLLLLLILPILILALNVKLSTVFFKLSSGWASHCKFILTKLKDMPSTAKLMDLPVDILTDVFSRLPATSLFRLQCVSRTLRDLISDPALVAMHLRYKTITDQDLLDPPQLRVLDNCKWPYYYKLVFAYSGLLGFAQVYGGRLFLYNPMRPELLKLPVCDADQYVERSDIFTSQN